ncbi:MAG TPA: methyltransferase domain-containing protein [Candidatus Eisenbacteria bacterium]
MTAVRPATGVVAGNVYDKYGTRNPVARRLMAGFERAMFDLLATTGPVASVLEVGCGEGHMTAKLARFFPGARVVGSDLSPDIVAEARARYPGLAFAQGSIYDAGGEAFDLVVACEVLEHLEDPARALEAIARAAHPHVFVSVPREPLWRALNLARGRYLSGLGNTPGHLQHWSAGSFRRLLEDHLEVRAVRTPLPWTQALCRARR